MRVLIIKPSSLGDVVQALPVLRLIKQHHPSSEIHWWIDAGLAPLLQGDPDLASAILFERERWRAPWRWPEAWQTLLALRRRRFDWVIDLQGLARSGIVAWLANGAFTVGVDDPREGARGFYDLAIPRPSYGTHAVDWYLSVLPALGVPVHRRFTWLPKRLDAAAAVLEKWPVAGARWLALHPGASWLNKRWPPEYYAELVRALAKAEPDLRFAILGGSDDSAWGESLAAVAPARCLNLMGRTSLPELVEWIRLSEAIVTNDTGPMHVAAALGTRIVAIFGPTDPHRTGPYGQLEGVAQASLPCVPCMKDQCRYHKPLECLRVIQPSAIVARVRARLGVAARGVRAGVCEGVRGGSPSGARDSSGGGAAIVPSLPAQL
jgi:lipopolysaccharide heptosyltransferase I